MKPVPSLRRGLRPDKSFMFLNYQADVETPLISAKNLFILKILNFDYPVSYTRFVTFTETTFDGGLLMPFWYNDTVVISLIRQTSTVQRFVFSFISSSAPIW